MLLREFGIDAMAIHGENSTYDQDFIRHIKKYCKNIMSLYDWDEAGYKASDKLLEKYQIIPIPKPNYLNCKDLSDCYRENSELTKQFIKTIYEQ